MKGMRALRILPLILFIIFMVGCGKESQNERENDMGYNQITQKEAARMMKEEKDYINHFHLLP